MSATRPDAARLPTRRAMAVAASVAAVAVFVYVIIGVLAPRSVTKPPTHLSANDLTKSLIVGGLGGSAPTPSASAASSASPASSYLTAAPTIRSATAPPTAVPRSDLPARLQVAMNVDKRVAKVGDMLTYEITAKNVGGQTFSGALTINTHTPTGTLRCDTTTAVVNVCTTQGDYDGSSKDPNAPHNNPPGVTHLASIKPGATVLLETLVVEVAPNTSTTVLHNHAHVDGLSSVTQTAPNVTTEAIPVAGFSHAPDVQVLR